MLSKKIVAEILEGSLSNNNNGLAGVYRGYHITINFTSQLVYTVLINATSTSESGNSELDGFLAYHQQSNKYLQGYHHYNNQIELNIAVPNLLKNVPERVNTIVTPVINFLASNAFVSGCGNCGTTDETPSCYEINGRYHYLCQACAGNVGASLEMNQQNIKAQKSNLVAGLVGAFLGALIGCIVYVLIYRLGYIAGIAGAITAICAFKGYEMLGKHLDLKGVISSLVIVLIMIFLANKLAWSWEIYDAYAPYYDITFFDAFISADEIIAENDLTGTYYGELFIGYLLMVVGSISNIIAAFKASTGSYSMKKMN